jgi:hypothetical protein
MRSTVAARLFGAVEGIGKGSVFVSTAVGMGGKGRAAATWAMLLSMSTTSKVGVFANCGRGEFNSCR